MTRHHAAGCRPTPVAALLASTSAVLVRTAVTLCGVTLAAAAAQPAAVPPAGFDTAAAADAELARYGFPPRPDRLRAPLDYRDWSMAVSSMDRIVPVLQVVNVRHGPVRERTRIAATVATSSNWSGYVAAAPAYAFGAQSLVAVHARWELPIAQPGFGACRRTPDGDAVYSSSWVGLDGDGSADVLQAGTESDAVCSQGQVGAYQGAWYEWYPYDEVRITNLPAGPGAAMYVHVWASDATEGHAYIANTSAHKAASVSFAAPPGVTLIGNSAEWIVERPLVDGVPSTLTNYVQEVFSGAGAAGAGAEAAAPGTTTGGLQPALQVEMTDADGHIVSVPSLLGPGAISFADQGSARGR